MITAYLVGVAFAGGCCVGSGSPVGFSIFVSLGWPIVLPLYTLYCILLGW
jgi:hypothetical protein